MVNLGDVFPNFEAKTTEGTFKFHDYIGDGWGILFSHPADYTPVCTTELGCVVQLMPEFKKRNVKLAALSCDDVESHKGWSKDVLCYVGEKGSFPYPIIEDVDRKLAVQLGMVDPDEQTSTGLPLTCRAVFVIGPDKKVKLSILYPATTGRNFRELLRVIDSLQLTATQKLATPADWEPGMPAMVVPSVSTEDARKLFKDIEIKEVPSGKEYIRMTKDYKI